MTWWPGWDSIDGTNWWAHFWFWFGIACLFLLGASEIVAFRYGLRKDALVEIKDQQREAHTKQESDAAEARRAKEVTQLKEQLAEADKKSALLLEQQAPRRLSAEQKHTLIGALSPFRGQKISLWCLMNDAEGLQYASDFVDVFKSAGWDYGGGSGINQAVYSGPIPPGVQVWADSGVSPTTVPGALGTLVFTLARMGIISGLNIGIDAKLQPGDIRLNINAKP